MSNAKQEILAKLRKVSHRETKKPDFTEPVFHELNGTLEQVFKENLEKVNGKVHIFSSQNLLAQNLKELLRQSDKQQVVCIESVIAEMLSDWEIEFSNSLKTDKNLEFGITGCEFLIAHTGSVMVSSAQQGGRKLFAFPEIHIVVASKSQLVGYLEDAYSKITAKYGSNLPSQISLITGPSRTADIEKTLTLGAHGPKELQVFLY